MANMYKICQHMSNVTKSVQTGQAMSKRRKTCRAVSICRKKCKSCRAETVCPSSFRTVSKTYEDFRSSAESVKQSKSCQAVPKKNRKQCKSEKLKTVSHRAIPNAIKTIRRLQKTRKTLGAAMLSYVDVKWALGQRCCRLLISSVQVRRARASELSCQRARHLV